MTYKNKVIAYRCGLFTFGFISGSTLSELIFSHTWIYGVVATVSAYISLILLYHFAILTLGDKVTHQDTKVDVKKGEDK